MRIGIDYTAAVKQGGGIGRYTRNLVRALAELDADNRYTLLVAGGWGEGDGLGAWPTHFRLRSVPLSDRWMHILWQRFRLPLPVQLVTGPLDLYHSPDFVLPPTGRVPAVVTVHDLSFLRVPECFVPGFADYLTAAVGRAVRKAAAVLADSESTRCDLIAWMGVEPERIHVVYPGVEGRFRPLSEVDQREAVASRYGLPRRFVLGLGTLQPRKNFAGLIAAFGGLLSAGRDGHNLEDLHLVIAGGQGWMSDQISNAVREAGLDDRVHLLGFVREEDLPTLYNLAVLLAFPSWYEGFGLPVLEAMACGTPVVAADNSSLPEVVGEAGLLVPAADNGVLAAAMARILTEPGLRTHMVAAGLEQARRFTWRGAAEQVQAVYHAVTSRSHGP